MPNKAAEPTYASDIVKVQIPIFYSGPDDQIEVLIYNRDRSYVESRTISRGDLKEFRKRMGNRDKAFFHAYIDPNTETVRIQNLAPDQDW